MIAPAAARQITRRCASIRGTVQGVGFRPFVARLAADLRLAGLVRNRPGAVEVEIEGPLADLDRFDRRLRTELPPAARICEMHWIDRAPRGETEFRIEASAGEAASPAQVPAPSAGAALAIPPDLAACDDCLAEVGDPSQRRHQYPFANCTRCGPRFTIVADLPYDRDNTAMAAFAMCEACRREYRDPGDRRYHAQPIACPACGPRLTLTTASGGPLDRGAAALAGAIAALRRGDIVAVKGLGGYQLLVCASDGAAVQRLRDRKRRPAKPMAVLVADLEAARALCHIDDCEAAALRHAAAPIVLLAHRGSPVVAAAVAGPCPRLGLMLPATPLHALLARGAGVPLVCTSGNLHDEPICIDEGDARARLGAIADLFLGHDRAILRRCDDSVVHVVAGRMRVLRAGRGLAPVALPFPPAPPIVAVGGHLKQAPVLAADGRAILWPHVGDLDTALARTAMAESIADAQRYLAIRPALVAADAHPDYASTLWARACGLPVIAVQHHHAHVAAALAEHGAAAGIGIAWDGTGLGADGTLWGGEVLRVAPSGAARIARLRPFPLPGGDAAARDGRRALAGLCAAAGIAPPGDDPMLARFAELARRPRLAPATSSVGRLFDAVAALTGIAERSRFEGEAAMRLEAAAEPGGAPYPFAFGDGELDWRPALAAMLAERGDPSAVATRFHATLVAMIGAISRGFAPEPDPVPVVLSGGCFQNRLLLAGAMTALAERGVSVLVAERVPVSDGGLALGQAWVAAHGARHRSGTGQPMTTPTGKRSRST